VLALSTVFNPPTPTAEVATCASCGWRRVLRFGARPPEERAVWFCNDCLEHAAPARPGDFYDDLGGGD
jgi:hypothetical protein